MFSFSLKPTPNWSGKLFLGPVNPIANKTNTAAVFLKSTVIQTNLLFWLKIHVNPWLIVVVFKKPRELSKTAPIDALEKEPSESETRRHIIIYLSIFL